MHVDESTPLTDAERRYLLERGHEEKVRNLDAKFADYEADEDDEDEDEVEDYLSWNKAALQAELTRRELDASGKVDELRARLVEHDAAIAAEDDDETGD
jgi:hypothetical protein